MTPASGERRGGYVFGIGRRWYTEADEGASGDHIYEPYDGMDPPRYQAAASEIWLPGSFETWEEAKAAIEECHK